MKHVPTNERTDWLETPAGQTFGRLFVLLQFFPVVVHIASTWHHVHGQVDSSKMGVGARQKHELRKFSSVHFI